MNAVEKEAILIITNALVEMAGWLTIKILLLDSAVTRRISCVRNAIKNT